MHDKDIFVEIMLSISKDYERIYYVNTEDDSYVTFFPKDENHEVLRNEEKGTIWDESVSFFKAHIYKDDLKRVNSLFSKEKIFEALKNNTSYSFTFRAVSNGYVTFKIPRYFRLKIFKSYCNGTTYLIIGVKDVDKQVRKDISYYDKIQAAITYTNVANTLSKRYYDIFYVNVETHQYKEFHNDVVYNLDIHIGESDFWADMIPNSEKVVYHEDLKIFQETLKKENLLSALDKNQAVSLTYRLVIENQPTYMSLRAVYSGDNKEYIIIGIENIDAQLQKENDYKHRLSAALNQANRDELTGVKNKNAFRKYKDTLQLEIDSDEDIKFAIVVCDINNLKGINDAHGHVEGDNAIKEGCMVICTTFKHSPVFRIGGDEFVAVLRNNDYINRHELVDNFKTHMLKNKKENKVVVAIGISDFNSREDHIVNDVFIRADDSMYANKHLLKN